MEDARAPRFLHVLSVLCSGTVCRDDEHRQGTAESSAKHACCSSFDERVFSGGKLNFGILIQHICYLKLYLIHDIITVNNIRFHKKVL
jgi:hypothetical protein